MITRARVIRAANDERVPAQTVERDYVIAHVLAGLTRAGHDGLVFKGGTALRYYYLDECRYSADLDFSLVGLTRDEALVVVARALEDERVAGGFEVLGLDERDLPRIRFVGPLGRERAIKLDLATDELVVDAHRLEMRCRWDDVEPSGTSSVYSETEIGGEKLRCVIQRLQCRDLLDLDVVFEELAVDAHQAAATFQAKARHRGIDPEIFKSRYQERLAEYEARWDEELREHLADDPTSVPSNVAFGATCDAVN